MNLSIRAMRYFQAAVRHGSIKAAAEEVNVAPSAIATAVDQVEAAFGMTLVTRARAKGIFPTSVGRDVLRRIDDLLERYHALHADLTDLQSDISGTLVVGYNAPIAPAFLPQITAKLIADHPHVTFQFIEGDNTSVQQGLLDGQLDAILFVEEMLNPQIETIPLIYAPTYCLCASSHPLATQKSVTVDEIVTEPLILLDRPAARSYYVDLLKKARQDYHIVATANSTEMVRSLVSMDVGISLLNMRPRDVLPYAGSKTRSIPIVEGTTGVTLSLGFAPGPKRRLVQAFADGCGDFFNSPDGFGLIVSDKDPSG